MTLDELKNLDFSNINPNDPGSWPAAVKAASLALLFLVLLGGGYYFAWSDQLDSLKTAEAEEVKLRETFLDKKKQAINLDLYRQQLKDIEQSFGALLRQLPNKKEMDALVTDINQAGLGRGLEFQLFRPAQNETMSDFYAELPITISVTGSYHDFGAFASDIAQLPRIVTLADISITPGKGDRLSMNATAKTYRYLDDNEIAARKKPAKDKKK
ncbi:MAG: type 4a pilus biogenesis protein PilO [Sulfuricellaceae bacterium]|nr:type 4a pilus biogenesis protein PilO [Sulfuricellaceae bacterium]